MYPSSATDRIGYAFCFSIALLNTRSSIFFTDISKGTGEMLGNIFTESAGELRATIQEERQTLFFLSTQLFRLFKEF